jgi:hypothetical protein
MAKAKEEDSESSMPKYVAGPVIGLVAFVVLCLLSYFLLSSSADEKTKMPRNQVVGFPLAFWIEDLHRSERIGNPNQGRISVRSRFSWFALLVDLALPLAAGVALDFWLQQRTADKEGKPSFKHIKVDP